MPTDGLDPAFKAFIKKELAEYEKLAHPQLERELQLPAAFQTRKSNGSFAAESAPAAQVSRKPDKASRVSKARTKRPARLNYHGIRCVICKHPDRKTIEQDFLHWRSPAEIAQEFNLGHRRGIYRHAHALGLFKQRAGQLRHGLGLIMEQAANVTPTANDIIRAVRAYSCLDEDGHWHEPTRRVIITHQHLPAERSVNPSSP
ncbi:MAG TPA: hypothetical protein VFW94_03055 [Candidatus Acidoferrales bacterium]|nr:hypothetical protein [Candidatus Acidoferrales bacterium]